MRRDHRERAQAAETDGDVFYQRRCEVTGCVVTAKLLQRRQQHDARHPRALCAEHGAGIHAGIPIGGNCRNGGSGRHHQGGCLGLGLGAQRLPDPVAEGRKDRRDGELVATGARQPHLGLTHLVGIGLDLGQSRQSLIGSGSANPKRGGAGIGDELVLDACPLGLDPAGQFIS